MGEARHNTMLPSILVFFFFFFFFLREKERERERERSTSFAVGKMTRCFQLKSGVCIICGWVLYFGNDYP